MRRGQLMRVVASAAIAGGLGAWGEARAQQPSATASPIANPYMSPYANPYLNPALTVGSTSRNDALLYLWAAQQQTGGLLGPRPTAVPPRVPAGGGNGMRPGGNASNYFNRGPEAPASGLGNRYSRTNRYFPNNGR